MATTTNAKPADPFALAELADAPRKAPSFVGEIPDSARKLVHTAYAQSKRVRIPVDSEDAFLHLRAVVSAAAAEKGWSATTREVRNDSNVITHLSFTVGEKRGRKAEAK